MSDQNGLPKSWCHTTIKEVCDVVMGSSPPGDSYNGDGKGVPLVNGPVEFGKGPLHKTVIKQFTVSPLKTCKAGDLLLCVRGSTTGRTNVAGFAAAIGRGVAAIRAERVEQSFVNYFLVSSREVIYSMGTGSTFPNIRTSQILNFQIPLAPLNEQHRIVAKIEELFSDLDAGVAALERIRANLKRYRASVLKAAVEGRLTEAWRAKNPKTEPASKLLERILAERRQKWEEDQLAKFVAADKEPPKNWKSKYAEPSLPDTTDLPELPEGWCWTTLDAISTIIGGYAFQSKHFTPDGFQVVKIANVRAGHVDLSRQPEFIRVVDNDLLQKYSLITGDILISLTGTRFKRDYGYTAVVNSDALLLLNQRVARIRPFEMDCSQFLQIATTTPQFKDYFFSQETGNVGQGNVGMDSLRNAPLPLCPVLEQQEIATEVEVTTTTIDALEAQVSAAMKRAARLRQCILKRAFEGKLVPQDPTDEPASALLARIRASREAEARTRPADEPSRIGGAAKMARRGRKGA